MQPRVSLITLGVADLARSRDFYEALGFVASPASQGDVVFFQCGGLGLALYPRAKLAEDRVVKPAQPVFWGGYSGYLADPDGHLWEIAHNPYFPLAEDGSLVLPA
jgi:catechol 2,3-dioxygenase-like lactoylglutathione lyase family enzyme